MTHIRRMAQTVIAGLVAVLVAAGPGQAAWAQQELNNNDENSVTAVNTTDGASIFRLAFSIAQVTDGVVDQENLAVAYASCTDCRTVALAFQVVIVVGDADYVAPINQAGALNDQCAECLTFASATQIVIRVDEPVTLTPEGWRRAAALAARLAELEKQMPQLTAAQLAAEVNAIEQELIKILDEELVPVEHRNRGRSGEGGPAGSTTTSLPSATTTTTATQSGSVPPTTRTTATTSPPTTAATAPSTTAPGG